MASASHQPAKPQHSRRLRSRGLSSGDHNRDPAGHIDAIALSPSPFFSARATSDRDTCQSPPSEPDFSRIIEFFFHLILLKQVVVLWITPKMVTLSLEASKHSGGLLQALTYYLFYPILKFRTIPNIAWPIKPLYNQFSHMLRTYECLCFH